MLAVTTMGIALGPVVNRVRHQKRVVETVARLGGQVHFDHESSKQGDNLLGSGWLGPLIGDDYFRTVRRISLQGCPATDELVADIALLNDLVELNLVQTRITDESLQHIAKMRNLKALSVGFNAITNEGLEHLAPLDELVHLDLCVTKVTDDGLAALLELPKLHRLELFSTRVSDSGATTLSQMPALGELDVADTWITNDGVAHLAALPNLTWIRLDQCSAGLGRELRINDAGLEHVARMPKLREVHLIQLDVTDAGLSRLKQTCPTLTVVR
jgi:hypothetical protein